MKRLALALAFLLAACGRAGEYQWLGYAEGEDALIAAPQPGWVTGIAVTRGAQVKPGDVLFTLDGTHERDARDNAAASLAATEQQQAQAEANLRFAASELTRQRNLVRQNAAARRDLEQAQANYDLAAARVAETAAQRDAAKAALATAEWNLSERTVRARTGGRVEDIYFRAGEYAPANAPVVSVLPPANVYVRFFVPETQVNDVSLGQAVVIACDGCPSDLKASVTFIAQQAEFTPPIIYSIGNRERLVFKAEARAPGGLSLRPGLPVTVTPAEQ